MFFEHLQKNRGRSKKLKNRKSQKWCLEHRKKFSG